MSEESRAEALNNISAVVPKVVFERFIMVLTQIEENNNNALVNALDRICRNVSTGFTYSMNSGETEDKITPIREALDLLEGWMITSTVTTTTPRVRWGVESIIGKEVK